MNNIDFNRKLKAYNKIGYPEKKHFSISVKEVIAAFVVMVFVMTFYTFFMMLGGL